MKKRQMLTTMVVMAAVSNGIQTAKTIGGQAVVIVTGPRPIVIIVMAIVCIVDKGRDRKGEANDENVATVTPANGMQWNGGDGIGEIVAVASKAWRKIAMKYNRHSA